MDSENHSPFPHLIFEKAGKKDRVFDVIVVAGTFDLVHGQPLPIADIQKPINGIDLYAGAPETSGFLQETQLILTKQRTDIHLLGSAKPADGRAATRWPIGLRVGPVLKTAWLHGSRAWVWSPARGWHLVSGAPAQGVALHMGMAYGGFQRRGDYRGPPTADIFDAAAFDTFADNPAGKGYLDPAALDRATSYPAAQIEDAAHPIADMRRRYVPVAFGPLPRWSPARVRHLGTTDARWQREEFPYLPSDFDVAYYQSAQTDLMAPSWLEGDEPITLVGCRAEGRLDSQLPGLRLISVLTDSQGHLQPEALRLDTVTIDLDDETVQLVWRRTVPKNWGLRHVLLTALPDTASSPAPNRPVYFHRASGDVQRG